MDDGRVINPEAQILQTWVTNADPWTTAVRQQAIASRRLVTDVAIAQTVLHFRPQTVLDLGCGEGWLTRRLSRQGLNVLGVDAVSTLIEHAQELGEGRYQQIGYEAVVEGQLECRVDLVVCNFSLFGKESVEQLVEYIPNLLRPGGALVIQTLNPETACGNAEYTDGWRQGSWDGFSAEFVDPAPWYFRRQDSWESLLTNSGFQLHDVRSPLHPQTHQPVSLILTATVL